MLGTGWTEVVALAAAFVIAVPARPAGISGAVLLLPFQVSVLGTPSPAVTPTNLLYNVVATPGGSTATGARDRPEASSPSCSSPEPCPASSPGRAAPRTRVFGLVVAVVLLPLGAWLAFGRAKRAANVSSPARIPQPALVLMEGVVGCVGGMYGTPAGAAQPFTWAAFRRQP